MRKKLPCLLLAGALGLSLAACAPAVEEPGPTPTLTTPPPEASVPVLATPAPEPSPEPSAPAEAVEDYDLPDREYQPWQTAYMDFLARLRQIETGLPWDYAEDDVDDLYKGLAVDERGVYVQDFEEKRPLTSIMSIGSESYSLSDVDRDGVPELFVFYGFNSNTVQCYTWRDSQVVCVGEFHSKDSGLYTHPDKNAVLRAGGRMGYYQLYEYPMEGGILTEEREIFSEGPVDFPTGAEEIVPGAQLIGRFWVQRGERDDERYRAPESEGLDDGRPHPSAGKALLLPIADWQVGSAATGSNSEQARTAILAALNGEKQFYGASGDHFYGDVGWTAWAEYIQPGAAYPWNEEPLEIKAHVWLDMNGDGQEECLLWVVKSRGEDSGKPWTSEATVVLSEQGGTVYAYFFGIDESIGTGRYDDAGLRDDGTFISIYGSVQRLSFWRDQCYEYAVPDASAPAVKWVEGAPAG